MFSPQTYEELVICGDAGRIKSSENSHHLDSGRPKTEMEVMCGERKPSKISTPAYPAYIEKSGHSGATFYEHSYFIDNIMGEKTQTATAEEGFWSVIVGVAAEQSVRTGAIVQIEELLAANNIVIQN